MKLQLRGFLSNIWYWIRCHTYNRYHVINVSRQDGYRWGWLDRDKLMYLACFKILVDFVEKEYPTIGKYDYSRSSDYYFMKDCLDEQSDAEKEIRLLYNWWKFDRVKEHEEFEKIECGLSEKDFKIRDPQKWLQYCNKSKELKNKDDSMFLRLIHVREWMWT